MQRALPPGFHSYKCFYDKNVYFIFFISADAFDVCVIGGQCLSGRCLNGFCTRKINLENYMAVGLIILLVIVGVFLTVIIRCRANSGSQPRILIPDISLLIRMWMRKGKKMRKPAYKRVQNKIMYY